MTIDKAVPPRSGPQILSLRKNFSWTVVGNAVYAGCQWAMLIVLAKLGNPEMVGQFSLGLAITAPIFMFANLESRSVQATDAKHEYHFGDYFSLRIITSCLALVVITATVLISGYTAQTALVILFVALSKACESLSDVIFGFLQQHERMDRIARSMLLKGPTALAAMATGVILTHQVAYGAIGMALVYLFRFIGYDAQNAAVTMRTTSMTPYLAEDRVSRWFLIRPRWDPRHLLQLARLCLPMGFVAMLLSLNTNIPRYVIQHYWGERSVGMFSAIAYIRIAGTTVVGALAQSASPRLAHYYATGNRCRLIALLAKLLFLGVVIGVIGIGVSVVAGKPILTLLYGPEYAQAADAFILIMIASGVAYVSWFLNAVMVAVRYLKVQVPLYVIVSLGALITALLTIPTHGMQGAAYAMLVSSGLQLLGSAAIVVYAIHRMGCSTSSLSSS